MPTLRRPRRSGCAKQSAALGAASGGATDGGESDDNDALSSTEEGGAVDCCESVSRLM